MDILNIERQLTQVRPTARQRRLRMTPALRGMVREVIALAAWIAGLVAAFRYMEPVATIFSGLDVAPPVRHVLAFALIVVLFPRGLVGVAQLAWDKARRS